MSLPRNRHRILLAFCLLAACRGIAAAQAVPEAADPLAASPSAADAAGPRGSVGPALVPPIGRAHG